MIAAVADTHSVVWYLMGDSRLSPVAKETMDRAAAAGNCIAVSTMTLVELVYLIEKKRLAEAVLDHLLKAIRTDGELFVEAPLDQDVVRALRQVPRVEVPELPDRVIAATAIHHRIPLITRDRQILDSGVDTVW